MEFQEQLVWLRRGKVVFRCGKRVVVVLTLGRKWMTFKEEERGCGDNNYH